MVSYSLLASSLLFPKNPNLGKVSHRRKTVGGLLKYVTLIPLLSFLRPGSLAFLLIFLSGLSCPESISTACHEIALAETR